MRPLVLLLVLAACRNPATEPADAGLDLPGRDTARPSDGPATPLSIDFTVEGCPSLANDAVTCTGNAPLTLRFVPIASTGVTKVHWDFGDGSAIEPDDTPTHTYVLPGVFTVRITGLGTGDSVVSQERANTVIVASNPAGSPCQLNDQCGTGMTCLCAVPAACPRGPQLGMCTTNCQQAACGEEEVCANLLPTGLSANAWEPWQGPFCLPGCVQDADCPTPLRCRTLPGFPSGTTWVRGCFSDFPVDLGAPCMDEFGALRDDLCVAGYCATLGAKGLCAQDCSRLPCPPGSQCGIFGNGQRLCLRECSAAFRCDQDALLTCSAPGDGDLGFRIGEEAPPNSTYCAPKLCTSDDTCGGLGRCRYTANIGHCVTR